MEIRELVGLDMNYYYEKLSNGLEVFMVPYSNKKNYFMSYATRYGSDITRFIPVGKDEEIKVPDGIAHFLEHKMFEQEDGIDPFSYFSKSGTDSNASTSYDYTQYICCGTKKFEDNLRYLIKFVNSPYYTDDNVEKEKGIITEELKMYEDIPEYKLDIKLRENLFHNHPRRIDIGGTVDEITKITKEDLYTCYNNFYSPNNMFILLVGNFDKELAMSIIHEELDDIDNRGDALISKVEEDKKVRVDYEEIEADLNVDKVAFGIKISNSDLGNYNDLELDLYLTMITTLVFGSSSLFREKIRNEKLATNIYTEWESVDDMHIFYMMGSSEESSRFIEEVKKELLNIEIDEADFTRMKKVWIANEVKMIDDVDSTVHNVYDDIIKYKRIIPDKVNVIRNMDFNKCKEIISKIDFNNIAVVKMTGYKKD